MQICASIPATKPFFTLYLPQLFDSLSSVQADHYTKRQKRLQKRPHVDMVDFDAQSNEVLTLERATETPRRGACRVVTLNSESGQGSECDSPVQTHQMFDLERGNF